MDLQQAPITVTPMAEGYKVALIGSVHTNTAWIEREMDKVVAGKPRQVALDLAGCSYISSSGIGTLAHFFNRIRAGGGTLKVTAIQKPVFGVLRFARLDKLFQIDPAVVVEG